MFDGNSDGFPQTDGKFIQVSPAEAGKVYDYGFIGLEKLKTLAGDSSDLEKLDTFFESLRPQTARIFSPETSSDGTIEPDTAYTYVKMGLIPLHKLKKDKENNNFMVFSRLESSIQNNGLFGTEEGLVKAKEAYREYKKNTSKGKNALTVLRETQEELESTQGVLVTTKGDLKESKKQNAASKIQSLYRGRRFTQKLKEAGKKLDKVNKELEVKGSIFDSMAQLDGYGYDCGQDVFGKINVAKCITSIQLKEEERDELSKYRDELISELDTNKLKLESTTKERNEFLQKKIKAEDDIKALKGELITNNAENKSLLEELDKKKGIYDFFSDTLLADLQNYGYEGCNDDPVDEIECMKTVKKELEGNQEKKRELQFLLYEAIPQYGKNEEEFKKKLGDLTSELEDKIEAYGLSQAELKEANSELEKKKGIYNYFSNTVLKSGNYQYGDCKPNSDPLECLKTIVERERTFKREKESNYERRKDIEKKLDDLYERAAEENNIEQCKNRDNEPGKKECEDAIIEELKQIQKYKSQRDMAGAEFAKNVNLNLFYEEVKRRQRGADATTRDSASCAEAIMSIINREIELNEGKPQEKKKRNQKSKIKKLLETRNKLVVDFFSGDIFTQDETDEIIKNVLGEKAFEEYKNNIQRAQDNPSFLENFRKRIPWKTAAAAIGVTTLAVLAAYLASKNPEEYPDPGPGPGPGPDPGSNFFDFTNSSTPNPGPGPGPGPIPDPTPIVEPDPYIDPYNPPFNPRDSFNFAEPDPIPPENPTPEVSQESSSILDAAFNALGFKGFRGFLERSRNHNPNRAPISGLMMPHTARSRILASRLMY